MSAPTGIEFRPGNDALALVRYAGRVEPVKVRRRGSAPWRCSEHGARATCPHVIAAALVAEAHRLLHDAGPDNTEGERP